MTGAFVNPYDIANRGLQMIGVPRITAFTDLSRQAAESSFLYDKARRAELRRFVWTFATRRAVLRARTATTVPITFPTYAAGTTYAQGDIAVYQGENYISQVAANVGNTPDLTSPNWQTYFGTLTADTWSASVAYLPGDAVVSAGNLFIAKVAVTGGVAPVAGATWLQPTGATTGSLFTFWPEGYQPNATVRAIYTLPSGFLRLAPQDPKQPAISRLGTSGGIQFNDWEVEAGHIYSAVQVDPLVFRFVADVTNVPQFDDMFCEATGLRMGLMLNEVMNQRPDVAQLIGQAYVRLIREAQAVSAIEAGTTEPDIGLIYPTEAPAAAPGGR